MNTIIHNEFLGEKILFTSEAIAKYTEIRPGSPLSINKTDKGTFIVTDKHFIFIFDSKGLWLRYILTSSFLLLISFLICLLAYTSPVTGKLEATLFMFFLVGVYMILNAREIKKGIEFIWARNVAKYQIYEKDKRITFSGPGENKITKRYLNFGFISIIPEKRFRSLIEIIDMDIAALLKEDLKDRKTDWKKVSTSTSKYRNPKDLFLFLLQRLEQEGGIGNHVTFENKGKREWVQVAFGKETGINFSYPYDDEPTELLSRKGILFPQDYVISDWEKRKFATFAGPKCPHEKLADIIDLIFRRLLNAPSDYVVEGHIE